MSTDPAVSAAAEATRWEKHGVRYGDDDCLDCFCGWSATGKPDRVDLYRLHVAEQAVAAARPIIEAEYRERIAADLLAVDPVEWALAGQHAGEDAARIARGQT